MLLILLCILIPSFIYFYIRRKRNYEKFWKPLLDIPGPKTIPFIGSNTELHTPESLFERERQRGRDFFPIYRAWTLHFGAVIILTPEDAELVLTNTKHINKNFLYSFLHPWLGSGLLTSGGTKWHKRRKILTPAFHFNILQEFVGMLNNETKILVENLKTLCEKARYIDVVKPITDFTLNSISETSLGVSLRDYTNCKQYKEAVHKFGRSLAYRVVHPLLYPQFLYKMSNTHRRDKKNIKILHDFSTNIIKEKKQIFAQEQENQKHMNYSQRKRLALLDLMLQSKVNGADINENDIREEVDTFIFEGHDTTSVGLCYLLMALANEQDIQKQIYQEILTVLGDFQTPSFNDLGELKFMERCIKESLRLYPPVPMIGRLAGEDIHTKTGYTIPNECNIAINIYDIHRRPEYWPNPEKFDPDRFLPDNISKRHPFAYIPFSAGSRNCIGQRFAWLELKAALCGILRNFKLIPVDKPEDMKYKADMVLRPAGEIRVKFLQRV